MSQMFKAVRPAIRPSFPESLAGHATLHRRLTVGDAQSALNRVRGIRLTAGMLRHMPALAEVIERGGAALLPMEVLRDAAVSLTAGNAGLQDQEAEAFAIVGIACTYGRATGQIGRGQDARELRLAVDAQGLHLAASERRAAE